MFNKLQETRIKREVQALTRVRRNSVDVGFFFFSSAMNVQYFSPLLAVGCGSENIGVGDPTPEK